MAAEEPKDEDKCCSEKKEYIFLAASGSSCEPTMEGPPLAKRQIRNRGALTIELSLVELRFPSYRGGGGLWPGLGGPGIYTAYTKICLVPVSAELAHLPGHEINQANFLVPVAKPELSDDDYQLVCPFFFFYQDVQSKENKVSLL